MEHSLNGRSQLIIPPLEHRVALLVCGNGMEAGIFEPSKRRLKAKIMVQ
jgi:hypothetical protein